MQEQYQREIEEILEKASNVPGRPAKRRQRSLFRAFLRGLGSFLGGRSWKISPGRIILGALILLLSAWWFKTSLPGLVGPIAWAAVVLFILGYALFFINPRVTYEKRWRGQLMEPAPPPWWERFRRRWAKRD